MNHYIEKQLQYPLQIEEKPAKDLNICIVIPCFNEDDILRSLNSIKECSLPKQSTEIIIVVNSGENTEEVLIKKNQATFLEIKAWIKKNSTPKIKFHTFNVENMPHKFAGVGFARKIGMDEAYSRLISVENPKGIITGFDADSTLSENYLIEIEKHFYENKKTNAASIYFEHPLESKKTEKDSLKKQTYAKEVYDNIILYELYLRYYKQALEFANFPFAYHTIGSSFAVRAEIYAKQGGMNKKKAGEDFYFLQKIIPLGNFAEINTTAVFPSPRPSDRVPFGTGAAIQKMLNEASTKYISYNIQSFIDLKLFFEEKNIFFKISKDDYQKMSENTEIPEIILQFLSETNFYSELEKINSNSPNLKIFETRFFQWFNAFRVLKFLNFSHEEYYEKSDIQEQASNLLQISHEMLTCSISTKELLIKYRELDKE